MQVEQLGPYKLGKRIGKGGMGSVYEAVEESTGQRVAVKSLSPQLAVAEGFRERFEAEIESLKILQHPGIVRLLGYGEDAGVMFYSMELVDGPSLEQEITAGRRFDWRETLQIGIQVCKALKHAHDHGVVHRDIKPANLLLAQDERVKIADFGIARLFGATQLTTAGGVLGTADYMSPEQADGRPVTEKCDQYSLGSVMYALLSGRPPFRAKNMPEMLQMQRYAEAEPVTRYAPRTPAHLEGLIKQLLSKEPEDRFPNVMVLARHMEAMEKALSRRAEQEGGQGEQSSEPRSAERPSFHDDVTQVQDSQVSNDSIDLLIPDEVYDAPTLAESDELELAPPEPRENVPRGATVANSVAQHSTRAATAQPGQGTGTTDQPSVAAKKFTTVDEEARRRSSEQKGERWALLAQVVGLLLSLVAVIGTGWWLLKPKSADQLYASIQATVQENGGKNLRLVEDEVEEFAQRFPDDPRLADFAEIQEEIELSKLAQRLRAQSLFAKSDSLHPIQQIYGEAIAVEEQNPGEAAEKLRGLLDLYGNPADQELEKEQLRWLELAERKLEKLDAEVAAIAEQQLPALEARLRRAVTLQTSDSEAARNIYAGLIKLYADKPWAEPIVETARAQLQKLNQD